MNKATVFWTLLLFGLTTLAQAQKPRTVGLMGSVQDVEFGIQVPIWFAKNISVAPGIGFTTAQDIGSELTAIVTPRYYFRTEEVAPYVGLRGGAIFDMPNTDNNPSATDGTDWIAGIAAGAEYFFVPKFSIGVEAQGNFSFSDENSDRFGNPGGTNFNLATIITASVYF